MIPRLTATLDFHSQALTLRAERQRLIAGNIANADTPGFKARDFDFASALRDATGNSAGGSGSGGGNGIGQDIARGLLAGGSNGAQPRLQYALPDQTRMDNNSVDMNRERSAFVDNAVKYEATLRFINGQVRTLQDAMKSHNQG